MEVLSFKVAQFDAPLELILHLLSKHKLTITDIDISSLLSQYLEYISGWQENNLDISSEFLEMASRLVYMKTLSLLPRHEEESEKMRLELCGQLVEYGLCKLVAAQLGKQNLSGDIFVRPAVQIDIDQTYTLTHHAGILYSALLDARGKGERFLPPPRSSFEQIVERPVVSVTSKIFTVLRLLRANSSVDLDELFNTDSGRSGMVATFLAVLELVKTKKIILLHQTVQLASGRG